MADITVAWRHLPLTQGQGPVVVLAVEQVAVLAAAPAVEQVAALAAAPVVEQVAVLAVAPAVEQVAVLAAAPAVEQVAALAAAPVVEQVAAPARPLRLWSQAKLSAPWAPPWVMSAQQWATWVRP
ncbi:hypothetical protein K0P33_04445 [Pseudomonas sp. ArH3a]|nr:hypothetical protein K0P33_04445 [Pseudomonas sp. ArH3a]